MSVRADLLRDFQDQFPAASARIENAYTHIRMKVRELDRDESGNTKAILEDEFLRSGDEVRGVVTTIQSADASNAVGDTYAFGGSPEQFFEAVRRANSSNFAIESLRPANLKSYDAVNRNRCRPVFGVYCLFDTRVVDLLKFPDFKLLLAEKVSLDEREAVKVTASWPGGQGVLMRYQLYFAPDTWTFMGWTIYGHPEDPSAPHSEWRLTYEPGSDPPKLVKMDGWGVRKAYPGVKRGGMTYDVESLQFGPIPASEFTVAALGVEAPASGKPRAANRWLIALNVAVFGGLGILFAILAVRFRHKPKASQ